jgi:hypothetical protein
MSKDRSAEEIENTLAILKRVWIKFPNLRLGQLITNATIKGTSGAPLEVFFAEDTHLEKYLKEFEDSFVKSDFRIS